MKRGDCPAGHGFSTTCHGWLRLLVMQVSKPAVQYLTFAIGSRTADTATLSTTTRLPPKTIQPCQSRLAIWRLSSATSDSSWPLAEGRAPTQRSVGYATAHQR
jgi:hypothetical protein